MIKEWNASNPGRKLNVITRIVFTSSLTAEMPGSHYAVYAASKASIQPFAEVIRYELRETKITVTDLQLGSTETEFFACADIENTKAGHAKKQNQAEVALAGFDARMSGKDHVATEQMKGNVK